MTLQRRFFGSPVLIPAMIAVQLGSCSDLCANDVIRRFPSPDGAAEAVLFQRDCGATTGFSTQVAIVSKGEKVSAADAIFVADDDRGAASAAEWGGPWAAIEWSSPARLTIRYDRAARVFRASQTAGEVTIDFLPSPPPS